jgi:hypothetical protein
MAGANQAVKTILAGKFEQGKPVEIGIRMNVISRVSEPLDG